MNKAATNHYTFVKMCCILQISITCGVFGNFSTYKDNNSELILACKTNSNYGSRNADEYPFLYNYLQRNSTYDFNESITIGFLGAYGQAQVVLGALPLVVEDINNSTGNFIYISYNNFG